MYIQPFINLNTYQPRFNTAKKYNASPISVDRNYTNTSFGARGILPNLSATERMQFFDRLNPLTFFYNESLLKNIAPQLKTQITQRFNGNVRDLSQYLQSIGRTIFEINLDAFMILLNNDEILPDMRINGMNYYLTIPSLSIQADNKFCPTYPFFNEDDYYASPDANPVYNSHPKYLRIYGEGYADFSDPDDLRLCKKIWNESSNIYMSDTEHYLRTVSEHRQRNQRLHQDKDGIYYKEISEYDLPDDLRDFPIYMNLKDGSLHAGNSEVFKEIPDSYSDFMRPMTSYGEIERSIPNYGMPSTPANAPAIKTTVQNADIPAQTQPIQKQNRPKIFEIEFDEDPAKDFYTK